jgi:hypothetical protein
MSEDEQAAEAIPVAQFEGEFVREMEGKLPAITLAMAEGYPRGTIIRMQIEVRVRNIHYDEIKTKEHRGELIRQHLFALESAQLVAAFSPEEDHTGAGGGASATAIDPEAAAELGVEFGRTSDQWGATG